MGDIKSFFHQWCTKNSKEPQFDVRQTGIINSFINIKLYNNIKLKIY